MLTLWQSGPAGLTRPRGRYALYREGPDGPSLALFSERAHTLLAFGDMAAERFVREQSAMYQAHGPLAPGAWGLSVWPSPGEPPALAGVVRLRAPHWMYDFSVAPAELSELL
jgi:hypothetical protein